MDSSQLLVVLVAAVVVWAGTALLRRSAVPTPVVLVIAGLVLGFVPFVPDVTLQPHVVLLGLLPLLVFQAALSSSPRAFANQAVPIGLLAVGLVAITAGAVALLAHELDHLGWPMSFVLGTAVGATDSVAATSIAGRLGLPRRLVTILEGEALFNDATALVLYAAAVTAATSGQVSVRHTAGALAYSCVVGTAVGLAVSTLAHPLRRALDDPPMEIALSLLLAYASYLPAEALGASGVLAAVTAGLVLGWQDPGSLSARSRLQSTIFWETLVFLVEGALFILVGLSLHGFTATARGPLSRLAATAAAVAGAVIAVRLAWITLMSWALRPLRRLGGTGQRHREQALLGWAGMRGAVTLAAALAVPTTTHLGARLAGRDDVISLAFAVILVTLVGQGLTLPLVARRWRPGEDPGVAEAERDARLEVVRAALARLEEESETGGLPEEVTDALRAQYGARARRLQRPEGDPETHERVLSEERSLRHELLRVQRQRLLELRGERRISTAALRSIERDLDLDEARLR